jgi:hypothetical protein
MAYVTYILAVGIALGKKEKYVFLTFAITTTLFEFSKLFRFSPEQLGITASSALGWFLIEVILICVSLQILNVKSLLKTFDIMAFCGYKYFG